jgi:hypothetical protein
MSQVPPFFPIVRSGCEEVANTYFQCIENVVKEKQDIHICGQTRENYSLCTNKSLRSGPKTSVLTEYQET